MGHCDAFFTVLIPCWKNPTVLPSSNPYVRVVFQRGDYHSCLYFCIQLSEGWTRAVKSQIQQLVTNAPKSCITEEQAGIHCVSLLRWSRAFRIDLLHEHLGKNQPLCCRTPLTFLAGYLQVSLQVNCVQKAPVVVVYHLRRSFFHPCLRAQATRVDSGRGFEIQTAWFCWGSIFFLWIFWWD